MKPPRSLLFGLLLWLAGVNLADAELNFVAMGDWGRDGKEGQRENAAQMGRVAADLHARFVLALGDNFYLTGVKTPTDTQWKTSYEDIYTAPSLQVPWYVALGNHDYVTNPQAQLEYAKTHPRWRMPARFFTWTEAIDNKTTAQFFCIDTSPFLASYRADPKSYGDILSQDPQAQLAWLERELAASTARWKIVFGHHPVYSASALPGDQRPFSARHGDTPELVAQLKPLLERYGVQVYLSGHEHDLQHLRDEGPVNYFVAGAGSQVHGSAKGPHTLFCYGDLSGFLAVRLTADVFHAEFINCEGKSLYTSEVPAAKP